MTTATARAITITQRSTALMVRPVLGSAPGALVVGSVIWAAGTGSKVAGSVVPSNDVSDGMVGVRAEGNPAGNVVGRGVVWERVDITCFYRA